MHKGDELLSFLSYDNKEIKKIYDKENSIFIVTEYSVYSNSKGITIYSRGNEEDSSFGYVVKLQ